MATTQYPHIPGYKIDTVLGQGGMSTVYLGVQENLNREIAIKVLSPEMFSDEQYLQRFLNEAQTASQLQHPNIVTIHDVGQTGDWCYIVMERLQESLTERVKFKPDHKLNPIEAFKIVKQIASALDYAHREGVIHRDIKPDNVLFRRDGTPVLVDFGIARALHSRSDLTTTGMIIGTPHYMSPEQCKGEQIDGQSDIYSLGVVAYEILTGNVPYKADSTAGVLLQHVQGPLPVLPTELSRYQPLISRMMAKNKRERVRSGDELVRLIDHFGPNTLVETIKGIDHDTWHFSKPDIPKKTPTPPPPLEEEDSGVMTLHSPIQTSLPPSRPKSRASLVITLVTLPIILVAAYFIFFHNQFNFFDKKETQNQTENQTENQTQTETQAEPQTETQTPPPETQAPAEQQTEAGTEQPPVTPPTQADPTQDPHKRLLIVVEEYLKDNELEKARQKLKEALAIEDSPEARALEQKINQQVDSEKEKEFVKYSNLARDAYENDDYEKAKENIQLAKQYKTTDELEKIEQHIAEIEKKKADEAEKVRQAAARRKRLRQQDDDAYRRAVERNTIYSYEKYLKQHPKGRHAAEAQKKYDELKSVFLLEEKIKDDTAYELAKRKNSIQALEDYLGKYPSGRHINEARVLINQLKEKILRETKIKLTLQQVRFFESGPRAPEVKLRRFSSRFSAQQARYIYTQISFDNNLYRIADSTIPVKLVYTHGGGAFTQELKGTIRQDRGAGSGIYWRGMGWSEAGKWPTGRYTVVVYIEDQQVGESHFEIN